MAGYIVPTLIASRASFDRFGGFSTDGNTSDTGWFARAIERGAKLDTLPDVLLRRRLHRHNNSRVNPDDSVDGLFDLIRARRREQSTEGGE